jgi:hypothetical protein
MCCHGDKIREDVVRALLAYGTTVRVIQKMKEEQALREQDAAR